MYKKVLALFFAICLPLSMIAVVIAANGCSGEPQITGEPIVNFTPLAQDVSLEKLRAVGISTFDFSPLYIVFCPIEKTISVYDSEGWLVDFREFQDEDAFWTLVETNAKVAGHSMAGNMEFFLTRNATIFENDDMMVIEYDSEGIRTVIAFDKNMFVLPHMPDDEALHFRHLVLQSVVRNPDILYDFETVTEYDDYGNSVITVIVEETFFEDFVNNSLHSLSNQELSELIAPFRAIALAISDTYELNWTFFDIYYPTGRYIIIMELESTLLSTSLEEYEQNLRKFVPFLWTERLINYVRNLIDKEYEAGIISREQMIEMYNMIFRSGHSFDQVIELKETLLQKLHLTLPHSAEVINNIDNIIIRLQNFGS